MRFPDYYPPEPAPPPPPSLADEALARIPPSVRDQILRQQRETAIKVARTKATLALHQLALDHQADDAAAHGTMADNGEGWRDQSMARFDARAVPLLAGLSPELKAEFAPQLANLRDRRSAASETQQSRRREAWARNAAATLLDAALERIGNNPDTWPDEHAAFASHVAALPLDPVPRDAIAADAHGAFRHAALAAHVAAGRDDAARVLIAAPGEPPDPRLDAALAGMIRGRDTAVRQKATAERIALAAAMNDGLDALWHGRPEPTALDLNRIRSAFGDAKLQDWLAARNNAHTYHATTADLPLVAEAEMVQRLRALHPAPDETGAVRPGDARLHLDAGREILRVRALRKDDPVAALRELPTMKAAAAATDPNDPAAVQALARQTLAAQSALAAAGDGGRRALVLTNDEARALSAPLLAVTGQPPDPARDKAAVDALSAHVRRLYGRHGETALHQIADQIEQHLWQARLAALRHSVIAAAAAAATPGLPVDDASAMPVEPGQIVAPLSRGPMTPPSQPPAVALREP